MAHWARLCSSKQTAASPSHRLCTSAADSQSSKALLFFIKHKLHIHCCPFLFDWRNQLSARQRQRHTDVHHVTLSFLTRQIKIALFGFFFFCFCSQTSLIFLQRHLQSVRKMEKLGSFEQRLDLISRVFGARLQAEGWGK